MNKLLILVSTFVVVLPIAGLIMARILEGPTDRYLTDSEVQEILEWQAAEEYYRSEGFTPDMVAEFVERDMELAKTLPTREG